MREQTIDPRGKSGAQLKAEVVERDKIERRISGETRWFYDLDDLSWYRHCWGVRHMGTDKRGLAPGFPEYPRTEQTFVGRDVWPWVTKAEYESLPKQVRCCLVPLTMNGYVSWDMVFKAKYTDLLKVENIGPTRLRRLRRWLLENYQAGFST